MEINRQVRVKLHFKHPQLLYLLLLTDLCFILLHLFHIYTDLLPSGYYSLTFARGYSEFFQYIKFLWIAALFLLLALKLRKSIYFFFTILFLYFLFDDSYEFHEAYGALIADFFHFQPAVGLRAIDLGELVVTGIMGLLFFAVLIISYSLSNHFERRIAVYMVVMVLLLGLFGVVFDMIEIYMQDIGVSRILRIVEEGGEMIVASVMAWFAFWLNPYDELLPLSISFLSKANTPKLNENK